MVDFKLHSLKNFENAETEDWIEEGMRDVASKLELDLDALTDFINDTEREIARRAKFPTIDDNSLERNALRDDILLDYENLFKSASKGRTATIVLGQIAAGKSSFCRNLRAKTNAMIIDVDYIKQGHGVMDALKKDFDYGRGTDMIHEEASMLSKKLLSRVSKSGYDLIIPKTGIAYDSIYNMASLLKERGYKITLCYIDLPIKACIERNFYRFIDEFMQGIPCRLVPFSTIRSIDDKPFKTFQKFLINKNNGLIDEFNAYSNDVPSYQQMQKIDIADILQYTEAEESKEDE